MSIRFNCQHCQKSLKVAAELAGKRARCPGCKKTIAIPTLDPIVSSEIEDLAASAFADEPKSENHVAKDLGKVKFQCYYCDETVEVSAELAGQQTQCPECRRIVKVPLPEKVEPLDWRKVKARGPAEGLRRDEPAPPEGAWGSSTSSSTVSTTALAEADALEKPPATPMQWLRRGLIAAGVFVVLAGGTWTISRIRGHSLQATALQLAADSVADANAASMANLHAAEIHRGLGEYYTRDNKADLARKQFAKANARLAAEAAAGKLPHDVEALAIDVTVNQLDLYGSTEQAQTGDRVAWRDAAMDLGAGIRSITTAEGRMEAIARLTRKLLQVAPPDVAKSLAETLALQLSTDADRPEALAVVGLEYLRKDMRGEAEAIANKAVGLYDDTQPSRVALSPSLIALLTGLDQSNVAQTALRAAAPSPDVKNPPAETRQGYALGWALTSNHEQALGLANAAGSAAERWQALLAVAAGAEKSPDVAKRALDEAARLLEGDLKGKPPDAWSLARFAQLAGKHDMHSRATPLLTEVTDRAARNHALLEMARSNAGMTGDDSKPESNPQLAEWRARMKARSGGAAEAMKEVYAWEPANLRPYGYVGIALGLQDSPK